MELLVCLLVLGAARGRQQAISYQNFRAGHGQGHPTYGADGSWSQSFGGGSLGKESLWPVAFSTSQRFAAFPSAQPFLHQPQPFFNSRPETHIHTSGPPPPTASQITSYQSSQLNFEPHIPGNQNIINSGPHSYQSPAVSSFGPDSSHTPQSYGNDRLPHFADAVNNYNDPISNAPPAHVEQLNYHPDNNSPIENYDTQGNAGYPGNDVSPTPLHNEYIEGPGIENGPSYNPEQPKPDYSPQNPENSYPNEDKINNYDEPKRDFGPTNIEPNLQNPVPYNAPAIDVRNNNDALITDVRTHNEPISDLRSTDRPSSEVLTNRNKPVAGLRGDIEGLSDKPATELGSYENRPLNGLRSGFDAPRLHGGGPLADLKNNESPISDLKNTNDFRQNNRPLTDLRFDTRPHFGPPAKTNFRPQQGIRNKPIKTILPSSSPLDRPHGLDTSNRAGLSSIGVNQGLPGSKPFKDEKKTLSSSALVQKDGFDNDGDKPEFSEEDKNQSFESGFQSSEIDGPSFDSDIPDFGSDESYFNSQEGFGSFESGGRGSFESSGERKGGYERPAFNPDDNKRAYHSDIKPDFQSSLEVVSGDSAEPRNKKKFKSETEARHKGGEDKKIKLDDKKAPFPVDEKKSRIAEKGFPSARSSAALKDTVPLANTFSRRPLVAPFRPSTYNGGKFVPFQPLEKTFPQRGRGPYAAESRSNFQVQAPDDTAPFTQEKLYFTVQSITE